MSITLQGLDEKHGSGIDAVCLDQSVPGQAKAIGNPGAVRPATANDMKNRPDMALMH